MRRFQFDLDSVFFRRLFLAVFAVAWFPIVWLLMSAILGPLLTAFVEQGWMVHVLLLLVSVAGVMWLLKLVNYLKVKMFGGKPLF
ncbi:MAG TPA: hypothetical protein ENN50_05125 [Prosthecochloris aestuarii]|uniref:Uncharacterized protein n=1 Tax=Prosthecochloris aestuarii TaxID=1102 RepID=A0A831WRU3_PROAE|nr:hypothetical protein [Prosthecochloris aestuarii]